MGLDWQLCQTRSWFVAGDEANTVEVTARQTKVGVGRFGVQSRRVEESMVDGATPYIV